MSLNSRIRQWLKSASLDSKPHRNSRRRLRPLHDHVAVESLETRELLTTFSVANLNDAGPGSLRDAIGQANSNPGADTITFATSGKITLTTGEIQITESLAVTGNGAANTIIDGNLSSRIFDITNTGGDVTISDLTLMNGRTTGDDTGFNGGAIQTLSSGSLTINRSVISGNSVGGYNANGGAIYAASGMLIISESTLSRNSATGTFGNGGAVCSQSSDISLHMVAFSENSTAGSESRGGAVATISGALTASACTFSYNTTTGYSGDGGAIFSYTGAVIISQCTLSGNSVTGTEAQGGAVHVFEAPLTISQSTLTDNHATKSSGGGVYIYSGTTPLTIQNSIIAGNSDIGIAPDMRCLQADTSTVSNSLVGRVTGTGLAATVGAIADANGNFVGGDTDALRIDPKLGPLAKNGGPTQTHALLAGSLAIDHGSNAAAVDATNGNTAFTTDQRGVSFTRILDGDHRGPATVDMGAFEFSGLLVTSPNPNAFTLRPTFTYTPIAGAISYSIHINNESTGVARFHLATSNSSSYTPSVDLAIGTFKMWVRPNFAAGPGNWSVPQVFNILTSPTWTAMSLTQPTSRPTLTWLPLPGAVKYDLWISDVSRNVSPVYRNTSLTGTSWTPTSDLPLGRYYAWIRGVAADGTIAAWTTRIEFLIVPPPIVTQGMNSTFDRTPTFAWNSLAGAVKYEVFIRNQTTGATTLHQRNIVTPSFTSTSPLADGPYRWWVISISAQNIRGQWTSPMDFNVGGQTSLTNPVGSISSTKPTFQWRSVDGAAKYDLFVNLIGGQSQIIRQQNLTTASFTPTMSLPMGTYRAWIRAISSSGELGKWSDVVTFTIADAASSFYTELNTGIPVSLLSNVTSKLVPEEQKRIEENASLQTDNTDNMIDEFIAEWSNSCS